MPEPNAKCLSVTIRPLLKNLPIISRVETLFGRYSERYIIACESGQEINEDEDEEEKDTNHYQCFVVLTKGMKPSRFKNHINKEFGFEDDEDEKRHAVVVRPVKEGEEVYVQGYTLKENKLYVYTGFSEEELEFASEYYEKHKASRQGKKTKTYVSDFVYGMIDFAEEYCTKTPSGQLVLDDVNTLMVNYIQKIGYKKVPYSMYSKIRLETLESYLKATGVFKN